MRQILMKMNSGEPSIYLSPTLVQSSKPFQRDVHEASEGWREAGGSEFVAKKLPLLIVIAIAIADC